MTDAPRNQRADHATHDLHVLAAATDRTVDDATRLAAERQVAECSDCADLFADLRLISAAVGELLRELAVARDFRISPERAAQLRPAGWRGALQGLFGSGPSLRPLASALTTLGVAGLFLTVVLPGVSGGIGFGSTGAAAPAAEHSGSGVDQQQTGGGKASDSAAPPLNVGGAGGGAASSPTMVRDIASSPLPYASIRSYELNSSGSGALRPVGTATDGVAPQSASPGAPVAPFPLVGVLAAVSLGALLLGLFLLVRSRTGPFDSVG